MRRQAIVRLILIVLLFLAGNILFLSSLFPYAMLQGISIANLVNGMESMMLTDVAFLRYSLLMQSICQFLLPCLAFGLITYKQKIFTGLDLNFNPRLRKTSLAIVFLLAAYPLVNLAFMANQALPVTPWMEQFEAEAAGILEKLLVFETPWEFLHALFLIAVLPAIGEELLFRGIVQKQVGRLVHPVAAVWIAALLFSGAHLQFEGFLPRLALGAVLGYLYYWTKNLWIPILVHFFNNGIQVGALYFLDLDLSSVPGDPSEAVTPLSILIGIIVMYLCSEAIRSDSLIFRKIQIKAPGHGGGKTTG